MLEDAGRAAPRLLAHEGVEPGRVDDHDLARRDVAHQLRADRGEGARLGGEHVAAVRQAAEAERADAERVAHADHLRRSEDGQAVGAEHARHGAAQFVDDRLAVRAADQPRDDLRVGRGGEALAVLLQLGAQAVGVGEVAVVRHGDVADARRGDEGAGVLQVAAAGRRVARVADRRRAAQSRQILLGEGLRDQPHAAMHRDPRPVGDRDPRALLPAVLQGEEREEGHARHVHARRVDAEDAALLAQLVAPVALHAGRSFPAAPARRRRLMYGQYTTATNAECGMRNAE